MDATNGDMKGFLILAGFGRGTTLPPDYKNYYKVAAQQRKRNGYMIPGGSTGFIRLALIIGPHPPHPSNPMGIVFQNHSASPVICPLCSGNAFTICGWFWPGS